MLWSETREFLGSHKNFLLSSDSVSLSTTTDSSLKHNESKCSFQYVKNIHIYVYIVLSYVDYIYTFDIIHLLILGPLKKQIVKFLQKRHLQVVEIYSRIEKNSY